MDLTDRLRNYALGKQNIPEYKEQLGYSDSDDYITIDWTCRRIVPKIRKRLIRVVSINFKSMQMIYRLKRVYGKH